MGCIFLETCPFLLGCQISWHISVHSILLWFFVFLWYQLLFLLFHFLFCLFGFYFLPGEPGQRFSILFILSKNKLLVLLIFSIVFLISILFISFLIFIFSFLLLTLDFVCSFFLILSGGRLGCLRFFLFF